MSQLPAKNANGWNNTNIVVEGCAHNDETDIRQINRRDITDPHINITEDDGVVSSDDDCTSFLYEDETDFSDVYEAEQDSGGMGMCCGTASEPYPIRIDKTKPIVTYEFVLPDDGDAPYTPGQWVNQPVRLLITCEDTDDVQSGVDPGDFTYPE